MAANRPYPDELLAVLGDWLSRLAGGHKPSTYEARMARHAVEILRREMALSESTEQAERQGLKHLLNSQENDVGVLNQQLANALRERQINTADPALLEHLRASVEARLSIDNPKFNA